MEAKICEYCGITYLPKYRVTKRYWATRKFCSAPCASKGADHPGGTGHFIPMEDRFWSKVVVCGHGKTCRDCCWIWQGGKDGHGYGVLNGRTRGKKTDFKAHRVAYELGVGPIPEGLHVLHDCPTGDNPSCVNYNGHLWVGTQADNNRDRDAKGRCGAKGGHIADRRGLSNGNAKLPNETIMEIQMLYATGEWSQQRLATFFGCGQSHVSRIVRGEQRQPVTTPWVKPSAHLLEEG